MNRTNGISYSLANCLLTIVSCVLLWAVLSLLTGCPHAYTGPDRPVVPPDTDMCADGCLRLKQLGCPEGAGSEPSNPDSCEEDCRYVQENGLALSPSCWATMTSCDQLETDCSR